MAKFRKKPVVIEAKRWDGDVDAMEKWLEEMGGEPDSILIDEEGEGEEAVVIVTLEGEMRGSLGDWIIRGVKGEFYPCKPDIFAATYEPAGD